MLVNFKIALIQDGSVTQINSSLFSKGAAVFEFFNDHYYFYREKESSLGLTKWDRNQFNSFRLLL